MKTVHAEKEILCAYDKCNPKSKVKANVIKEGDMATELNGILYCSRWCAYKDLESIGKGSGNNDRESDN